MLLASMMLLSACCKKCDSGKKEGSKSSCSMKKSYKKGCSTKSSCGKKARCGDCHMDKGACVCPSGMDAGMDRDAMDMDDAE